MKAIAAPSEPLPSTSGLSAAGRFRLILRSLISSLLIAVGSAAEPILVVVEHNPWLMVIGSDSPTFALYDDGSVIWRGDNPTPEEPFLHGVTPSAAAARREIIPYDLARFADHYTLSDWSDQPTTVIWTPRKRISIYGHWRRVTDRKPESDPRLQAIFDEEVRRAASLPAELRATLLRIDEQRKHKGDAWLPERVEVMLWPYDHAPEESVPWPEGWPDLSAATTVKRGSDSYSVIVPAAKLAPLRELLALRRPKGALLVEGRKMSAAFRFPFPGEARWMNR